MNDERIRYLFIIKSESVVLFEGYLLHDEAWVLSNSIGFCSVSFNQLKQKKETDKNYKEILLKYNKNNI
jgi:hypothetical protein